LISTLVGLALFFLDLLTLPRAIEQHTDSLRETLNKKVFYAPPPTTPGKPGNIGWRR